MRTTQRRTRLRAPALASTLLLCLAGALLAVVAPASAHDGCPRPDRPSNVIVMQPDQASLTFPGAQSADFCGGSPDFARTALWTGQKPDSSPTVRIPGVGTWTVLDDGRLTFTVDADYRERPIGDTGPGHDAIMKFAIVDTAGGYVPGIAVAYVLYPGASAFPDVLRTCVDDATASPLSNDIAGWHATSEADKRQATIRPDTLRVADTGPGGEISTAQGTWRPLADGTVRFDARPGWTGTTPPLRYSVQDTFGNTASSTITAQTCTTTESPVASPSPRPSGDASARGAGDRGDQAQPSSDGRSWLPLSLAALCLVVVGLALWKRRISDDGFGSGF